ncbi:MAG: N-acetylneuraminate synthase [Pseudomonadota bacterium]
MNDHKTFIIAEAGVNHNGDPELAGKMIDAAIEAGADAVKFQTFRAEMLVNRNTPKAEYQLKTTKSEESQYEMIKRLELDEKTHRILLNHCKLKNIVFLSTPFDLVSIDLLNDLGLEIFKIPSGEITNLPYLRKIGMLRKQIILSTGMTDLGEIEDAIDVLLKAGTTLKDITILHCNTEYPTPVIDVNLNAMLTIKAAFPGIHIGYSDHSLGIEIPIAAVAMGAEVIEKHFTLDKTMEGPDHKASLLPGELKEMIRAIRNVEKALGNGIKKPSPSEVKNKTICRKSIVAKQSIAVGEAFTEHNLSVKRPGTGLSPMQWDQIVGRKSSRYYQKDDLIEA